MGSILTRPVAPPGAWSAQELDRDRSWVLTLSPEALAEMESAMRRLQGRGLALTEIRREDFRVRSLEPELAKLAAELQSGRGLALIKGLPVDRYTEEESAILYWGIGTHLGSVVSQNSRGELLGHVRDTGASLDDLRVRGYQTHQSQGLHVDNCDVVGLLCLKAAKVGGVSQVVSSMHVYNELLRRYPWYVGVLYNPFAIDMRGQEREGESPVYYRPVYSYYDGLLSCGVNFTYIRSAQAKTGVSLTAVQTEALDLMEHLASELSYEMALVPGDMQFLNNYVILHDRTPYIDYAEPERRRHLVRLWLSVPNGRRLAPEFRSRYAETLRSYALNPRV